MNKRTDVCDIAFCCGMVVVLVVAPFYWQLASGFGLGVAFAAGMIGMMHDWETIEKRRK